MHFRPRAQGLQQFAFGPDPVTHRPAAGQGMRPPCLVIAPLNFAAGGIEEQDGRRRLSVGVQPVQQSQDSRRVEPARSGINAYRQRRIGRRAGGKQPLQQPDGRVVDRFPAEILQHFERSRLSRAGHAGDDQNAWVGKGRVGRHRTERLCQR
jgi:hypothetical protein